MRTTTQPRINIAVSDNLHRKLKVIAAEQRITMKDLVESALKIYVLGADRTTNTHQQARG